MAKGKDSPSEMARARQSDGISVIFDQNSPASSRSRSRSTGSSGSERSSGSGCHRGRGSYRGRYRSSSSSSSSRSRSPSRSRSRSHPRCHRRSSRCGCHNRQRYGRHSSGRRYRSRSRSSSRWSGYSRAGNRLRFRSRSRSRSSGRSVSLSVDDKRELLNAAKANAMKILGTEKLELPESVKPFLSEQSESKPLSEPETRSTEEEPDDMPSPKMSPKRKLISFSINNSVVKPTVAAPSSAKVTPRVDIYESRKPYGHWVPVKSGQTSHARKHTRSTLR